MDQRGTVGISWYDRCHDSTRKCQHVYFSASLDGGTTFLPEARVSSTESCPDTTRNGAAFTRWTFGGDYSGLVAQEAGRFRILWADSRDGVYRLRTADARVAAA